MSALHLDFEGPIVEKEKEIAQLREDPAIPDEDRARRVAELEADRDRLRRTIYSELSPIQRVQLARHPKRPYLLDYVPLVFEDWFELHGDRAFADDGAMVGGLARLAGESLVVLGQQKGHDTKENLRRNFGMPHPEGYRKALRLMKLAEKFGLAVVTFIDTPGAYPGIGAEERGQAEAIARNLREMASLRVPSLSIVTGEGASGGALGIGVTDRILMLENAFYSVISPEGCAAILWKDPEMRARAAEAMKLTARDLLEFGIIEEIIPEPEGGAHADWQATAGAVRSALVRHLRELRGLA
ncbi:MAG: acetyl-CoA carboxylase carboxyltransferase subunit alpha, partial [Gemmatimonadetes bacterium]|nr:acetyl-CoA carboxylase carboxyltransferase subunit alpha [Gemmatimonadota bacterium]